MTLVQLEYLMAIYHNRSFSKAAEKCFVTQPTLSMQIQNLEKELEVMVFDRSKKPIQATDHGLKIIEQAEKILLEVERLSLIQSELKGEISGELRMAIIPTISPYLLPLFVSGFTQSYPLVHLGTEELVTKKIINALKSDELDIGIVATPLDESGIHEIPVYEEKMLIYVSPECPLHKSRKVDINDLDLNELWLLNEEHCFRSQILQVCKAYSKHKENNAFTFESGSIDTLIRMVDVRGGFTIVPELIIPYLREEQKKNLRWFKDPIPARQISIVTRRLQLKEKQIDVLKKEIIEGVKIHLSKHQEVKILPVV